MDARRPLKPVAAGLYALLGLVCIACLWGFYLLHDAVALLSRRRR